MPVVYHPSEQCNVKIGVEAGRVAAEKHKEHVYFKLPHKSEFAIVVNNQNPYSVMVGTECSGHDNGQVVVNAHSIEFIKRPLATNKPFKFFIEDTPEARNAGVEAKQAENDLLVVRLWLPKDKDQVWPKHQYDRDERARFRVSAKRDRDVDDVAEMSYDCYRPKGRGAAKGKGDRGATLGASSSSCSSFSVTENSAPLSVVSAKAGAIGLGDTPTNQQFVSVQFKAEDQVAFVWYMRLLVQEDSTGIPPKLSLA